MDIKWDMGLLEQEQSEYFPWNFEGNIVFNVSFSPNLIKSEAASKKKERYWPFSN